MEQVGPTGKRALITGGTKGIGAATVAEFTVLGADVCFVARSGSDDPRCISPSSRTPGRQRVVGTVTVAQGDLDILVNNVGTNNRKPWVEMSESEASLVFGTNLRAPMEFCRTLHSLLYKGNGAAAVKVSCVAAKVDVGSGTAYAVSKAGLEQFTRVLAVDRAAHGVRVNVVAPWHIRTPLTEPVLSQPDRLARILERTSMRRVSEPAEIAAAIAFLAMDKASFVTAGNASSPMGGS